MTQTTSNMPPATDARERLVANLMAVVAVASLAVAISEFVRRGSGIAWTAGAGLSVFGCAALLLAALLLGRLRPGALRTIFVVLTFIGAALTCLAAWFLESPLVMAGMVVMLLCWGIFILVAR